MSHHIHFDKAAEWDVVRHHPLVWFRPRVVPTQETCEVTLPLAVEAVEGRLVDSIGVPYKNCVVLAHLRLGSEAAVDLLILARSGAVAVVECKRTIGRSQRAQRSAALGQLDRYEDALAVGASDHQWLRRRIDATYRRFGFPDARELPRMLGLAEEHEQKHWWTALSNTISERQVDALVAIQDGARVELWRRSFYSLATLRPAERPHNIAVQRIGARGARPAR